MIFASRIVVSAIVAADRAFPAAVADTRWPLRMSQQSDMADAVYHRLSSQSVVAAHLVRELRSRWGVEHGIGSVHGFVREVATCLLHHEDVEVGDMQAGTFVPWALPQWDADDKIDAELMAMETFLDDENRYVFRKRQVA
ncbi:MAG: hypothetical protein IH623_17755 [Verrucomicrobia bacterium]|nr:hypothetical protein [Verrucomicrobiota bacterium]